MFSRKQSIHIHECLEQYLRNTYRTLFALSKRQDTEIELSLSGGLDSGANVGINAQLRPKSPNMYFVTNNHATRSEDYRLLNLYQNNLVSNSITEG